MSFRPPTIEEAQEEKRMLLERVKDLEAYILALQKISSNGHARASANIALPALPEDEIVGATPAEESANDNGAESQAMTTAAVAYRVLAASPKSLRLADVVQRMREAGWQGSGDDKTDQDRAYAAMYRAKDKFHRPRWAHWAVRRERPASSN